ncbi:filamentous hemagglutinin N-terminal domain-containing protein [Agrobacterium tumefaciens]|uniref:two-partner secretion domain-containing protein n=1 Tax=Agrobacterium tumefaciens TaxID=358 RepID=UPI003BA193E3
MNHIYRSIWNATLGTFVAASEIASGNGKKTAGGRSASARARLALTPLSAALWWALASTAHAAPTGGVVSAGQSSIANAPGVTTITQGSQNAAINWQGFSIGAGETVNFKQPNVNAVTLNRVVGSDPSKILGSLNANGRVFLVNPNGVMFAPGAQVNVGGIVASTLNISDTDLMAGRLKFSGTSTAGVSNQGSINAPGGYVALLGANVSNEGIIAARMGSVALAAGQAVTLDVAGDGLLNVTVDRGAVNALVNNGGLIQADGGQVLMTAQAAGNLLHTAVNNTGVVQAQTIDTRGGTIKLLGDMQTGTVNAGGTLDASAPKGGKGGFIDTSAAHVKIAPNLKVTTASASGLTGSWLIDPSDYNIAASGGDITGARLSEFLGSSNHGPKHIGRRRHGRQHQCERHRVVVGEQADAQRAKQYQHQCTDARHGHGEPGAGIRPKRRGRRQPQHLQHRVNRRFADRQQPEHQARQQRRGGGVQGHQRSGCPLQYDRQRSTGHQWQFERQLRAGQQHRCTQHRNTGLWLRAPGSERRIFGQA